MNGYLASMKESFKITIRLGIVFNPIRASILLNFNQDFDSFVNYLIFKYLITLNHLMTSFSLLVKFNLINQYCQLTSNCQIQPLRPKENCNQNIIIRITYNYLRLEFRADESRVFCEMSR